MTRVAVIGADAADWDIVAARVRHACLERCDDGTDPAWESAEAVAFVNAGRVDPQRVESALAGGKHVLVATRSAPPISDLERWCDLAQTHRVRLDVVNPQLARPSRRLIRQQIENGKLGEVGLVRISRSVSIIATGAAGSPSAQLMAALLSDVDLAVWLCGRGPDRVFASRRGIETGALRGGECRHLHLGFPHGGSALIMATSALPGGDETESLSVIAVSGAAYADDHQNRQLLFGSGAATSPRADDEAAVALLLDEFAVRVRSSSESPVELRRWRQLATIAAAVDRSAELQQAVSVELD